MNTVNNETDNTLIQLNNDCMQTLAIENEFNKVENCQPQIEKPHYLKNKMKIDEIN